MTDVHDCIHGRPIWGSGSLEENFAQMALNQDAVSADRLRHIVIVGGGTSGWMTAAALVRMIGAATTRITLIESDEIGTIGVGEATIPPILAFNRMLGLDETEFVKATQATAKLGIEFVDWRHLGHRYFHPFGPYGTDIDGMPFTHYWLRGRRLGLTAPLDAFSLETLASRAGKFGTPADVPGGRPAYAYHFDAGLYARFLRQYAERRGVIRVEGRIVGVETISDQQISSVRLADEQIIEADFFIDCSGFRALLIEGALASPLENWSRWLPVNRAVAMPSIRLSQLRPMTRSTAREAGWQWRIPLQHRTANGYVFCDGFVDEEAAVQALSRNLGEKGIDDPRVLRFQTGCRRQQWVGNCVAIGLAAGFLEPLESTSIHLVQAAISKLLAFLPTQVGDNSLAKRFNHEMSNLYEHIRDFLVAHYVRTERNDTAFWRHCRGLPIPDSLAAKLESFSNRGEVVPLHQDLFRHTNWFAVLYGQGGEPGSYHPIADRMDQIELRRRVTSAYRQVGERVSSMP